MENVGIYQAQRGLMKELHCGKCRKEHFWCFRDYSESQDISASALPDVLKFPFRAEWHKIRKFRVKLM